MSIQYAAAAQLMDREVLMSQFGASKLNRPAIRVLMDKIEPVHDTTLDENIDTRWVTIVTVYFNDSFEGLRAQVAAPSGISPPVSNDNILEKWRRLVRGVIDDARRDEIESQVLGMESLRDVTGLIQLLGGNARCPIDV